MSEGSGGSAAGTDMRTGAGAAPAGRPRRARLDALSAIRHGDLIGSILLTIAVMAVIVVAFGGNPWTVARTIVNNSLAEEIFLGQTIMTAAILVLTGLAAAIPFTARLWNIGGEGQMFAGAVVSVTLGIMLPEGTPHGLFVLILIIGAAAAGSVWGCVPGLLKAYFGINEIVTSLMLNFLAFFAANYVVTVAWPEIYAQLQSQEIHDNARFPDFWASAKVDVSVFIALAAALAAWLLITRTSLGFSIRSIGANPRAARLAGVRTRLVTVSSFAAAGAAGGLAGAVTVGGVHHDLALDLWISNYGYVGIAVALLARLNPMAVLPAAFIFSTLRVGSNSLQAAAGISASFGEVLIATFVITLMVTGAIKFRYAQN
ncbi:MAG: ABC transporter permease [bacterium]|nr:ABC transporter permease [bacterium]MXZ31369.1 ABC transporter permease [Acidimicrobiia bacterium]MDE0669906.1 ABC transporter permease [bacterium]MYB24543.1 ABC transporter permease [Acidimicrobiia bacterium]MYE66640.1 ABC transporter permease [Acidimicrobiia bacterium]